MCVSAQSLARLCVCVWLGLSQIVTLKSASSVLDSPPLREREKKGGDGERGWREGKGERGDGGRKGREKQSRNGETG